MHSGDREVDDVPGVESHHWGPHKGRRCRRHLFWEIASAITGAGTMIVVAGLEFVYNASTLGVANMRFSMGNFAIAIRTFRTYHPYGAKDGPSTGGSPQ